MGKDTMLQCSVFHKIIVWGIKIALGLCKSPKTPTFAAPIEELVWLFLAVRHVELSLSKFFEEQACSSFFCSCATNALQILNIVKKESPKMLYIWAFREISVRCLANLYCTIMFLLLFIDVVLLNCWILISYYIIVKYH